MHIFFLLALLLIGLGLFEAFLAQRTSVLPAYLNDHPATVAFVTAYGREALIVAALIVIVLGIFFAVLVSLILPVVGCVILFALNMLWAVSIARHWRYLHS